MLNKIDRENIENVVKYFSQPNVSSTFKDGEIIGVSNYNRPFSFEDNYRLWERNKRDIYDLFGQQLKVKVPLDRESVRDAGLIERELRDFMNEQGHKFHLLIRMFLNFLDIEEIQENKLHHDYQILDQIFRKGNRITRCFSRIEPDKKRLEEQQDLFSTLIQSLEVKGNLVLSIDPVDFITVSVGKSGWTSCHHPSGEYGTAGLAYMNDKASIVAYVETEDTMTSYLIDEEGLKHKLEIPNKIWRQMVTINPTHEYAIQLKHYPQRREVFDVKVSCLLMKLLKGSTGDSFHRIEEDYSYSGHRLQESNPWLDGHIFYCDYEGTNYENISIVTLDEYHNAYQLSDAFSETTDITMVGEVIYCASGFGDENYSSKFFLCDADSDDMFVDDYN